MDRTLRIEHAVAYSLVYTSLYLVPNVLPLISGVLIEHAAMSPGEAGLFLAAYLGAMSVAALVLSPFVSSLRPRLLATSAIIVQLAGYAMAAGSSRSPLLAAVGLVVSGLGNGALFATTNAAAARESHSAFLYGAGTVVSCIVAAAITPLMNIASAKWGVAGMFLVPAALVAPCLACVPALPASAATRPGPEREASLRVRPSPISFRSALLLIGILLSNLAQMMFYPFGEQLLVRCGYNANQIALIFMVLFLVAAGGGVVACILSRWERLLPAVQLIMTCFLLLSILVASEVRTPLIVASAINIEAALAILVMSVQFAVAATFDKTGRIAAAASGLLFVSWTIGPVAGGWSIEHFGFSGISLAAIGLCVPAILAFAPLLKNGRSIEDSAMRRPLESAT